MKPVTTDSGRVWRWGFLAAAGISEKRAAQLGSVPGCTLHAVAARDGERAEAFAQKHGASRAYAGYDALLQDSEVDCVYLAMPSGLRAPWVERAARSGKHVLCEKPAAGSVDELIEMLEVCEDHGVLFMDGTVFVHNTRGPGGIREDLTEAVGGRIDAAHFRLSVGCTDGIRVNGLEPREHAVRGAARQRARSRGQHGTPAERHLPGARGAGRAHAPPALSDALGDVILRRPSGWHRGTENRGDDPRPALTICVVPRPIRPPRPPRPRRRGWRFWRRAPAGG